MAIRKGNFCDIEQKTFSDQIVQCPNLAVDRCVLCDRDICGDHALHPKKGLRISIKLVTVSSQGITPTGLPNLTDVTMGDEWNHRVAVCKSCIGTGNDNEIKSVAAKAVEEAVATAIRATMSAKALSK